jgi:hypothetical protein
VKGSIHKPSLELGRSPLCNQWRYGALETARQWRLLPSRLLPKSWSRQKYRKGVGEKSEGQIINDGGELGRSSEEKSQFEPEALALKHTLNMPCHTDAQRFEGNIEAV